MSKTKVVLIVVLVLISIPVIGITSFVGRWFTKAQMVAEREMDPSTLLKRYEWFKEASAMLDKKQADIGVFTTRMKTTRTDYEGTPKKDWPRDEREQYNQWLTELAGVKASYNRLSAEYNAAMKKINWRFCNVGDLPVGASTPLPREYKPYMEE